MVTNTILKYVDLVLTQYYNIKRIMEKNLQVVIDDWNLFHNDVHDFFVMGADPIFYCLDLILTKYYEVRQIVLDYWFRFLTSIADCFVKWTVSDALISLYGGHILLYFFHFYINDYFTYSFFYFC